MAGRPMYEEQSDLRRERIVADEVERHYNVRADKLPISYSLDFMLSRDGVGMAMLEVKCRPDIVSTTYPAIMLSLLKWRSIMSYHWQGLAVAVAFGFPDGVFVYWIERDTNLRDLRVNFSGRTVQTRDDADKEPVVFLPVSKMEKISDRNVHEKREA